MKWILSCAVPVLAAVSMAAMVSCGSDSSTGNKATGSISGTITFRNPWPGTGGVPAGDVYIAVFSTFPPTGAPDAFTNPIAMPTNNPRTYKYTLSGIQVGTYTAVLVGWRGGVGNDKCVGMYWAFPDSVGVTAACTAQAPGPLPVTVKQNKTISNIDIVADFGLVVP